MKIKKIQSLGLSKVNQGTKRKSIELYYLSIIVTPGLATLNKREEMLLQKKLDNM